MPKREYSERYILSTPRARREFEGRDECGNVYGVARDCCPACGAPATDGRGHEEGARSLAYIQQGEVQLYLLECQCSARYHCYSEPEIDPAAR